MLIEQGRSELHTILKTCSPPESGTETNKAGSYRPIEGINCRLSTACRNFTLNDRYFTILAMVSVSVKRGHHLATDELRHVMCALPNWSEF